MDPFPPASNFLEWAVSGIAVVVVAVVGWAGRMHFTVLRHDRDIDEIKTDQKALATKDDVADIKADLRRLLDWALGERRTRD